MSKLAELTEKVTSMGKKISDYEQAIGEIRNGSLTTAIFKSKLDELRRSFPDAPEGSDSEDGDGISEELHKLSADQDTLAEEIRSIRNEVEDCQVFLAEFKVKIEAQEADLVEARSLLDQVCLTHCYQLR